MRASAREPPSHIFLPPFSYQPRVRPLTAAAQLRSRFDVQAELSCALE
jgi:hypothetical protein